MELMLQVNYSNFTLPREVYELIRATLPVQSEQLDEKSSLSAVLEVTRNWCIAREKRLSIIASDPYLPFNELVVKAAQALGLRKTKEPKFKEYSSIVIFGGTGLSHYYVWKDLLFFYNKHSLTFNQIYMLGGDRAINLSFDSLDIAYKLFPEDFEYQLPQEKIARCKHEMEMMEVITSALRRPIALKHIPIISVYTEKSASESQANTEDSIKQLLTVHQIPNNLPILFMGTLPYIIRQGIQAQLLMRNYQIETAATFHPLLETIESPYKGDLPPALYLDELHWLINCIARIKKISCN